MATVAAAAIVGRATVVAGGASIGVVVERDPELDLDLPAGDPDVFDDEAHELLALGEVQFVDA
ncbi:MAG: hypothetical protein ACRD2W_18350, partial [Acidimicrobiales bacterium]